MFTPKTHICYYFLCTSFRLWWHCWNNYLPATSAQEGWREAGGTSFIFPRAYHQVKLFHYHGSCCRSYLSFPRKDRGKEFNWGSCHTTTLYKKANENGIRCAIPACFLRDARWEAQLWALLWKGALQNATTARFACSKQGRVICTPKGTKPGQGKQWPSGMYWLVTTTKKNQYKTRPRNKIWKYHWLWFHSSGSPSRSAPPSQPSSTPDAHRLWELCLPVHGWWLPTIDAQYLLLLVVKVRGCVGTHILSFCGNSGKFNNLLCHGRNVDCSLVSFL